ncbi:MAG: Maf family protein [Pseudomonadota bacterium]
MQPLVLASTSPYRAELLQRLGIEFTVFSPQCDETPGNRESAHNLVRRLAQSKAQSGVNEHPEALIVGSDQVAEHDGKIIGKPQGVEQACSQLRQVSGRSVMFYTGVCVLNAKTGLHTVGSSTTLVRFRHLDDGEIHRYIERENPLDCAGSFKSEGLGVSLFRNVRSDDPTALVGLPLIQLSEMLRKEGLEVP